MSLGPDLRLELTSLAEFQNSWQFHTGLQNAEPTCALFRVYRDYSTTAPRIQFRVKMFSGPILPRLAFVVY